jgi:multiple antibiotic resistance protein
METELFTFFIFSFTSLITLVDPIGFAPIYLSLVDGMTKDEKKRVAKKGTITALIVLISFWLLGRVIFSIFGITVHAFRIAGGILFFKVGMDMLEAKISRRRSTPAEEEEAGNKEDIGYTPIGIPLIAGPGAITSVMILSTEAIDLLHKTMLLLAIISVMILTYMTFITADKLTERFGRTGLRIMQRIMGLILMVMAVQFIINGVDPLIKDWLK